MTGNMTSEAAQRKPQTRDRILVAEDDDEMRSLLAWTLRAADYEVIECRHGVDLLASLHSAKDREEHRFDLLISDIRLPGITGLTVVEGLRGTQDLPPVILITAFGDPATHERARQLGIKAVFDKPFDLDELLAAVARILEAPPHASPKPHGAR